MDEFAFRDRAELPLMRIVDDDISFRRAPQRLLLTPGYRVTDYASVGDILCTILHAQ